LCTVEVRVYSSTYVVVCRILFTRRRYISVHYRGIVRILWFVGDTINAPAVHNCALVAHALLKVQQIVGGGGRGGGGVMDGLRTKERGPPPHNGGGGGTIAWRMWSGEEFKAEIPPPPLHWGNEGGK
jgi:hypothetical protein